MGRRTKKGAFFSGTNFFFWENALQPSYFPFLSLLRKFRYLLYQVKKKLSVFWPLCLANFGDLEIMVRTSALFLLPSS